MGELNISKFDISELRSYCDNKVLAEKQYIEELNYDQCIDSSRYYINEYVAMKTGSQRQSGKSSKRYFIQKLLKLMKEGKNNGR